MAVIEWGKIVNTHGVRGELKVMPWVDDIKVLSRLVKSFDIDGRSYGLISVRGHKDMAIVALEGVDTLEKADALRNKIITTPREAVDLGEGHYFYSDIYGFEVYDTRLGRVIGVLDRIEDMPAGDIYVIRSEHGEIMVPMVPAFDRGVELDGRRICVETIKGMIPNED